MTHAIQNKENGKWVANLNPFSELLETQFSLNQTLVEGTEQELQPIVDALNVPVSNRFVIGSHPRPRS